MSMPRRFWQDMSTEEFAKLDAARVIALLPVGAIEQHGPHLPVATDACINQGVLARALEQMPDDLRSPSCPCCRSARAMSTSPFPAP